MIAGEQVVREVRNDRAVAVYERVQKKLTGEEQVDLDISETDVVHRARLRPGRLSFSKISSRQINQASNFARKPMPTLFRMVSSLHPFSANNFKVL